MKLKQCDNCLVYGTDNKPLSRARVILDEDDDGIIRLYFKSYNLRSVRMRVYVDFYDALQGLVRCFCELVIRRNVQGTSISEPWMGECEILEFVDVFQRQKDLRVNVQISADFTTEEGQHFFGTIKNISAGGIFMVTSQAIPIGVRFTFNHRFEKDLCRMKAKILRAKKAAGGFGYGCQFMGLTPETEASIRKFVFAKQMERQKKIGRNQG